MLLFRPRRGATRLRRELRCRSPDDDVVEFSLYFVLVVPLLLVRSPLITPQPTRKLAPPSGGSSTGSLSTFRLGADAPGFLMTTWSSRVACVGRRMGPTHGSGSTLLALSLLSTLLQGPVDLFPYLEELCALAIHQDCLNGLFDALLCRTPVLAGNNLSGSIRPAVLMDARLMTRMESGLRQGGYPTEEEAVPSASEAALRQAPAALLTTCRWRPAAARWMVVRLLTRLAADEATLAVREIVLAFYSVLFPGVVDDAEVPEAPRRRSPPRWSCCFCISAPRSHPQDTSSIVNRRSTRFSFRVFHAADGLPTWCVFYEVVAFQKINLQFFKANYFWAYTTKFKMNMVYLDLNICSFDGILHGSGKDTPNVRIDLRLVSTMVLRFNVWRSEAISLSPVLLIQNLRLKTFNPQRHRSVRQSRRAPIVLSECNNEDLRCLCCGHLLA